MGNQLDFSKLERLTPREDSWSKVCARLDAAAANNRATLLRFRFYSVIPLAASFVLVGLSILLSYMGDVKTSTVPLQSLQSSEISTWYNELGNSNSDRFEILDESQALSYLQKENHQ